MKYSFTFLYLANNVKFKEKHAIICYTEISNFIPINRTKMCWNSIVKYEKKAAIVI